MLTRTPGELQKAVDASAENARLRFEELVNCVDGIVWEADPQTFRFTFVSAQAQRILGYACEEWLEEGFWEARLHPDDRALAIEQCLSWSAGEPRRCFEYRMIARDRRVVWLKDLISVEMRDGQPVALRGLMVDISERKRLGNALQTVMDHIPCGISLIDADLNIVLANALARSILDVPAELLDGERTPLERILRFNAERGEYGPGDPEEQVRERLALARSREPHMFQRTRPDGTVVEIRGQPLPGGGFVTVYTDGTDISARKRTEDELRLSAKVFENSMQGISITDAAGRILKVNRAFRTITGYTEEEVVGRTHAILHSGRQDSEFYRQLWAALAEEGSWTGELWNRRKCGELYVEHLSVTRVLDDAGRITNYIGIFSDVSHAKAAQSEIERLSMYDAMTGLPNRTFLHDRLDHALKVAGRDGRRVALLAVDLDRLAHINEVMGHHIGDRLLMAAAERLTAVKRGADTVTRHIGDEFVVIMEELRQPQDAAVLAERILRELSRPFVLEGHEVNVSACIGIGIYPEDGVTPQVLLKHTDVALHHAKESGESTCQFFREDMNRQSMERLQIESNLRLALHRKEFHLVYQPQVELASGCITGMEVLLRWQHPEMGMVSPARFIPVAEETGHIIEIGIWVLREACRQTKRWHEQGFTALQVAVNVSARQFRQEDFARQVRQVLEETGLDPGCLELELTESMIMQRPERVVAVMGELRALGVKFSIDDFGTGYSSLSQLKRFPIDKLKIDQSFTRDIGIDANGTAITCAIIALGNSLRLCVVAEGVETDEQQRFLIDNGCHSMQGYLFSRPVCASEFHGLLLLQRLPAAV